MMPEFNSYVRLPNLSGEEILLVASADGVETLNVTTGQVAGVPVNSAPTGEYYQDEGAKIDRYGDRVLLGAASDYPAIHTRNVAKQDWLSATMATTSIGPWAIENAQVASLARFGSTGFVGGSRTSDARSAQAKFGYIPSSIGVASWGIADETANPTTATAYAYYGEAWRMAGVDYQPTFAMELEAVNLGGDASGLSTPFHPNCGGGTYGIQLGAGGGQTDDTSDCEAGIVFVNNPNSWKTGVIFANQSISGTDGVDKGYGSAMSLSRNHGIEWRTPETRDGVRGVDAGAMLFSTVSLAGQGQRIQFSDDGVLITNMSGELLFSVAPNSAPTNTLNIQAGTGQAAAGLYVQKGDNGSSNLGLYPAAGGELQIVSPVSNAGGGIASVAAGGFLHININGADYRLPLLTPEQAGG